MTAQYQKLLDVSDRRVSMAQAALARARSAVSVAAQALDQTKLHLDILECTKEARREEVLARFIGIPTERFDVEEVMQRLSAIETEIKNAGIQIATAEKRLEASKVAVTKAEKAAIAAEHDKARRSKALVPAMKAAKKAAEQRQDQLLGEEFLNGFRR